jgi:hypothetical protein
MKCAPQVREILCTEEILQCAPSWIAVDDFKPEELAKLPSFYSRMRPQVFSTDKQLCPKLAAVMEAPENNPSSLIRPSKQDTGYQG